MLPRVFTHNFQDPMQSALTPPRRLQQRPLLSSLSYEGMGIFGRNDNYNMCCSIGVFTEQLLGEDVTYVLPQIPTLEHMSKITYKICVSNIIPEYRDTYLGGLFTNSLIMNIGNFDKYAFLYIPVFYEYFKDIECGQCKNMNINVGGHAVHQAGLREPSYVEGTLILKNQKYPSKKLSNKQANKAFRSCIFR